MAGGYGRFKLSTSQNYILDIDRQPDESFKYAKSSVTDRLQTHGRRMCIRATAGLPRHEAPLDGGRMAPTLEVAFSQGLLSADQPRMFLNGKTVCHAGNVIRHDPRQFSITIGRIHIPPPFRRQQIWPLHE